MQKSNWTGTGINKENKRPLTKQEKNKDKASKNQIN